MNEPIHHDSTSPVPWPTSDQPMRLPDTSMLPDSHKAAPAEVGVLKQTVQIAHDTINRMADSAAPGVQKLGESVAADQGPLQTKADQLRETRDEWVEGARTTVRSNPLVSRCPRLRAGRCDYPHHPMKSPAKDPRLAMNPGALFLAGLIPLGVVALVRWAGFGRPHVAERLRFFIGFPGGTLRSPHN